MKIETIKKENDIVVSVNGRLDGISSPELQKYFTGCSDQNLSRIVLDLKELEYISSVGFRVIVASAKSMQAKKIKLVLAGLNGPVEKAFKMAALDRIFKIYETSEAAFLS